jgi:hypothetical protein
MSGTSAKQLILLGGSVAVLVAVVIYQGRTAQPTATGVQSSNPLAAASRGAGEGPVTDVRLALLQTQSASFVAPRRDPFRFKPKPAPVVRQVAPPVVFVPPTPSGPPPPPRIEAQIRLIGVFDTGPGGRTVALTDGTRLIHGREGDVIEGRYRLLKVDQSSVDIAYLDGTGRVRLPLSGR